MLCQGRKYFKPIVGLILDFQIISARRDKTVLQGIPDPGVLIG
jgi:hypothetical protein